MFVSELIGQLARRIYIGGDTPVKICIEGKLYSVDISSEAFHAQDTGKGRGMIAVIPVRPIPTDTLPAEQPREGGGA